MLLLALLACSGPDSDPPSTPSTPADGCAAVAERDITTPEEMAGLLADVQQALHPGLDGVPVSLLPMASESDFFYANLDLTTIGNDPRERAYEVYYNERMFDELGLPPAAGLIAILGHELKHVQDYTEMDAQELTAFGVWYATSDISEYERETDLYVLEQGCGDGLIAFREFLYANISDEVEAQKRVDYWTPEEIRDWMDGR